MTRRGSVTATARRERARAEAVLKTHLMTCLSCYRWHKGLTDNPGFCDLGPQLFAHADLMRQQEKLLATDFPMDWEQDALFLRSYRCTHA